MLPAAPPSRSWSSRRFTGSDGRVSRPEAKPASARILPRRPPVTPGPYTPQGPSTASPGPHPRRPPPPPRAFRRFYGAQVVAQTGAWMQMVSQSWLVLQLTASPFKLGLISTLQFAPVLLFSVVSGAVADRLPKRRVLVATQATLAGQAFLLSPLLVPGPAYKLYPPVLGLVLGLASVSDQPARQSYVVEMVGRDDVANAVALNSASFNAARIVGPAGGAGLPPRGARAPMREAIREGFAYALGTPRVRLALGLVFGVSLCVFNFTVYVPLLAPDVLGLGAEGVGFLLAALGGGAGGGGAPGGG